METLLKLLSPPSGLPEPHVRTDDTPDAATAEAMSEDRHALANEMQRAINIEEKLLQRPPVRQLGGAKLPKVTVFNFKGSKRPAELASKCQATMETIKAMNATPRLETALEVDAVQVDNDGYLKMTGYAARWRSRHVR